MEIHTKVWGEEQWITNGAYCGKKMLLKKGFQCSLHYHKLKDETFFVQSGLVRFELGDKTWEMRPGDTVHVPQLVRHRFTGLEDSEIFEFSTEHREDDSYRLEPSRQVEL